MRTILIYGTDIHGPEDWWDQHAWTERPIDPDWTMTSRASMDGLMHEAAAIAGIDGLAILLRGYNDGGYRTPELKASIEDYGGPFISGQAPTLLPFLDTGALSAITGYDAPEVAFDFANGQHCEWLWERFIKPFYDQFQEGRAVPNPIRFERSKNGRLVIVLWGINPSGAGIVNQSQCQRALDLVSVRMVAAGLGAPDFIVDQSWVQRAPQLDVFAVHDWFSAGTFKPSSVRTHRGVVVGVAVPGFHVISQPTWVIPRLGGQTLRDGLAASRAAKADYVLLEGFTDVAESAGYYRSHAWNPPTLCLDIIREHIQIGRPVPVIPPSPPTTPPPTTPGGQMAGLKDNGKYVGCEPGTTTVYADRDKLLAWEQTRITKRGQWFDIVLVAVNKPLRLNQQTKRLEVGTNHDGWGGQWIVEETADGRVQARCDTKILIVEGYQIVKPLHLEQRVNDFVDAKGARVVLPGCDMFLAYRQYLDGGAAALEPFVQESQALGFQVWRIWSQGDRGQNNAVTLSPKEAGYYDHVRSFAETLNANGIIPLITGFVDNQVVKSPVSHWTELGARLAGTATLMSGFNQHSKNSSNFGPWDLPSPGPGLIWSRGSDVDDTMTHARGAPASELHATRQSFERALMDATASPPTMRKEGGGGMIWMTEGNPFGDDRGYSETQAWKLGRGYSIEWALAVFHNRQSQFGKLMTAETARCGAAWVDGMALHLKAAAA